ncbi:MAG: excinuclease ABC subunit UvrC [Myxococcota bacterium]|nr:excinuclease ABC subunit UvrC [Myxococcota bacterium]
MLPDAVIQKLDALPAQPGVYIFKDKKAAVVYVGKAKSLRARVRSYFQDAQGDSRAFIPILQRTIGDLDTIVTANEKEATILENNLVKEYRPRFNVKLRDDKDFITLRLGRMVAAAPAEGAAPNAPPNQWPRLEVVRRPTPDGARYFGPYHSATAARRTLHLVNKYFQLRTCSDVEFAARRRPCLQHQIKRCPAPCVLGVDPAWYAEQVDAVGKFLEGRHDELSRELEEKMKQVAREMRFELAAVYRDQLRAIDKVRQEQRVVTIDDVDRDVVGLYREGELVEIALLHVRAGKLADVATYSIRQAEIPDDEIIGAFLAQHHGAAFAKATGLESAEQDVLAAFVPDEIILPCEPEGIEGIAEWLADRARHKVALCVPKRGHRVDLLEMANDNARHSFVEKRRQNDDVQDRLRDLQERLRLPSLPRRIECCDISHLGGGDTVGAIVAMSDGELDKKRYRTFNVRGDSMPAVTQGRLNDDYGAMYEVLARRFRRAIKAQELPSTLAEHAPESEPKTQPSPASSRRSDDDAPDLFVVDGGRGQLAVALAAAHDLGLHDLAIVALAKERETILGEALTDRVYVPGQKNPIPLKSNTTSLFLLARLRDEAHRFSNRARMRRGKKRQMHSPLDDIKGLGHKAKKALLRHVGNLATIRATDDATLLAVPGVSARHVKALRIAFPVPTSAVDLHPSAPPTEDDKRQRS